MSIDKNLLKDQYGSGKSMAEMAKVLNCSVNTVVYWMNKYSIERRSRSNAMYEKLNPLGDPFKIKTALLPEDNLLLGLGLGIYWGEGEKVSRSAIRVANTNPALLRIFKRFLLEICGVNITKFSYSIVCFNDTDPDRRDLIGQNN